MADTVYCAGVDLSTYLTPIGLLKGFIGLPPAVGSDYVIPGYSGALPAQLGRGTRTVTVGGLILGKTVQTPMQDPDVADARAAYHTALDGFAAAVFQNGEPFQLSWVSGATTRSTLARYAGGVDDIEQLTPWAGRVAVDFTLLIPYWS